MHSVAFTNAGGRRAGLTRQKGRKGSGYLSGVRVGTPATEKGETTAGSPQEPGRGFAVALGSGRPIRILST